MNSKAGAWGSKGLDLAADYIRSEFEKAGLDVTKVNGGAFQPFDMTIGATLEEGSKLTFTGPDNQSIALELKKDFTPLSFGNGGEIKGELVFAGYGIHAPEKKYDDFDGLDVKDKVVIMLRRSPRLGRADSPLGTGHAVMGYESLQAKTGNAISRGAKAVLFVTDEASIKKDFADSQKMVAKLAESAAVAAQEFLAVDASDAEKLAAARKKLEEEVAKFKTGKGHLAAGETDALLAFNYGGSDSSRSIPVLHLTRAAADKVLKPTLNKTLSDLEKAIDEDLKQHGAVLTGWSAAGEAQITRVKADVKNVIGVLDGEGPLADETIVIGAHYDHVGRGGNGSLAPGSTEIHNGADDNASGTVALVELARRLGQRKEKPARRLVFIAFTAEERGLIGSDHYIKNPVFPLEKTVAMLNMDMVGRLLDEKLTIFGTGTATEWKDLIEKTNQGFQVVSKPEGYGPSDHSSFYKKKVPVLHFFTGTHSDYHRPGDDWEKINIAGVQRVTDMIEQITLAVAQNPKRPEYLEVKGSAQIERGGNRPYFGSIPDFGTDKPGYALGGVASGSPADKGGLKSGDLIIQLGAAKIENLEDFDLALRRFSAGDTVDVTVMRGTEKVTLKVTLEKPR